MDTTFHKLRRLPFSTILAARNYGLDNISVPENAQAGAKLCMAILRGDNTEAGELLRRGCDINHHDEPDGWTPLIYSIYYNNAPAQRMLLDAGADIFTTDYAKRTPLIFAVIRGNAELTEELLSRGARIDAVDYRGKSAIDFAREYQSNKCMKILQKHLYRED